MTEKITRVAAIKAVADGALAYREGGSMSDCPHKGFDDVAVEFRVHYWRKGFRLAAQAVSDEPLVSKRWGGN